MPFGVLVMPGSCVGYYATVYLATSGKDGAVTIAPFKRLPSEPGRSWHLPNGDLRFTCVGGDVVITTAGEIRMAERDKTP
jgi:hypothetical protein